MFESITIAISLLLLAYDASGNSYQLTILHTNDCHSRFEQINQYGGQCSDKEAAAKECFGGVARRMTRLKQLRSKEKNVLFLDGGDQFQGTFWFFFLKGRGAATFMNKLGYDVMVGFSNILVDFNEIYDA
jgi:5'-nucleotidase